MLKIMIQKTEFLKSKGFMFFLFTTLSTLFLSCKNKYENVIFIFEDSDSIIAMTGISDEIKIIYNDSLTIGESKELLYSNNKIIIKSVIESNYKNLSYCLEPSFIGHMYNIKANNSNIPNNIKNDSTVLKFCGVVSTPIPQIPPEEIFRNK